MGKKKFIFLSYFILLLFMFTGTTKAVSGFDVTVNGDLVTLSASYVSEFRYKVGGNEYTICSDLGDDSGTDRCQISVQNGTYTFIAVSRYMTDGVPTRSYARTITTSCSDQSKTGRTDSGTVERCFIIDAYGNFKAASGTTVASCATGYKLNVGVAQNGNGCVNVAVATGQYRYCRVVYSYSCTKETTTQDPTPQPPPTQPVAAASLSSLSVDGYALNPGFNAGTMAYNVYVPASVSRVTINATAANGSFVQGAGPRSVNLAYGSNVVWVKVVNSAGAQTSYKVVVVRSDDRNTDNTLKRLTVDKGTLTPEFLPNRTAYIVDVTEEVETIGIGADLNDSTASFVEGYGPRTVNLNPGVNQVSIKVRSQAGAIKIYNININKPANGEEGTCDLTAEELPLLKEIYLGPLPEDEDDEDFVNPIPQIEDFDPEIYQYTGIEIPYEFEELEITPYVMNEGDTFEIIGLEEELVVNEKTNIVIKVTSKKCPTTSIEYNLEVERKPEGDLSNNPSVDDIIISSKKDKKVKYAIDFEKNVTNYNITVNKGETGLRFLVETVEPSANVEITEPERFGKGAKYEIKVTSPDGTETVEYTIRIAKIKSGASTILLIILFILIILIIIYIVLRLMGYRIYFNPAMLGAMFRGNGKDKFDK